MEVNGEDEVMLMRETARSYRRLPKDFRCPKLLGSGFLVGPSEV